MNPSVEHTSPVFPVATPFSAGAGNCGVRKGVMGSSCEGGGCSYKKEYLLEYFWASSNTGSIDNSQILSPRAPIFSFWSC